MLAGLTARREEPSAAFRSPGLARPCPEALSSPVEAGLGESLAILTRRGEAAAPAVLLATCGAADGLASLGLEIAFGVGAEASAGRGSEEVTVVVGDVSEAESVFVAVAGVGVGAGVIAVGVCELVVVFATGVAGLVVAQPAG